MVASIRYSFVVISMVRGYHKYKQVWPGVKCKYGPLVLLVTITEQTVDSAKAMAVEGISMIESPLGSGN